MSSWNGIPTPGCTSARCPGGRAPIVKRRPLTSCVRTSTKSLEMLLEDGEPKLEAEFVGVQVIQVA
jgi:hypothetical protein